MNEHIYIYSPSGAVRDKASFRRGVKFLQHQGYDVEVDKDALASHLRFAGDDATRLKSIQRAAASGAAIALISRGGYGLTRILPDIDYVAIGKAIERGTEFVGISDFTAFQSAVFCKTRQSTWAGPALVEGFGAPGTDGVPDDIMVDCFQDLALGQGEGSGWTQSKGASCTNVSISNATLWGGNLTVLTSLMGTPFFPNIRNGVLYLEDVAEHPYRLERMLTQLLHSGVLDRQKAIVLGQFTDFKLTAHDKGFRLKSVVQWLSERCKAPVLTNLPYGHVPTKVLLPFGAKVDLAVEGRDVLLFWGK